VVDCTKKAREIIGDVLAFSRPTPRDLEVHDPVVLLHDSLRLVRQAIPTSLTLTVRAEGQPPHVTIKCTTFVQILLNLATNAAAAMDGQGELMILLDVNAPGPNKAPTQTQATFARLRVIDTGCGMDKAIMERAFEPFFTTKACWGGDRSRAFRRVRHGPGSGRNHFARQPLRTRHDGHDSDTWTARENGRWQRYW
jgi:signal transduction histidine kinase